MDHQTKAISVVVAEVAKIQIAKKSGSVLMIKIAKKIWAESVPGTHAKKSYSVEALILKFVTTM